MTLPTNSWKDNYDKVREGRRQFKDRYGFHITEEIHTRHLVRDKGLYRSYNWTDQQRKDLLIDITKLICKLDIKITNVIVDKTKIKTPNYNVLENALTYNIQRMNITWRRSRLSGGGGATCPDFRSHPA